MTDKHDLIEQILQTVLEHTVCHSCKDRNEKDYLALDNWEQSHKDIERLLDEPDEDELTDETAEWELKDQKEERAVEQAVEEDQERRADLKRKYKE